MRGIINAIVRGVRFRSGDKDTSTPTPECLQLLSRATQVFREEYILKLDLAREEMQKRYAFKSISSEQKLLLIMVQFIVAAFVHRVKLLTSQKNKQLEDLTMCREERSLSHCIFEAVFFFWISNALNK